MIIRKAEVKYLLTKKTVIGAMFSSDSKSKFSESVQIKTRNSGYKSSGKVYLYSGLLLSSIYSDPSRQNEEPKPLQEISSEPLQENSLDGSLSLFGFSIGTSRVDLDLNGFADLVVGDPSGNAQNAQVFYANTYIRFIHADTIPKRVLFQTFGVDPDCPYKNYQFCQEIVSF